MNLIDHLRTRPRWGERSLKTVRGQLGLNSVRLEAALHQLAAEGHVELSRDEYGGLVVRPLHPVAAPEPAAVEITTEPEPPAPVVEAPPPPPPPPVEAPVPTPPPAPAADDLAALLASLPRGQHPALVRTLRALADYLDVPPPPPPVVTADVASLPLCERRVWEALTDRAQQTGAIVQASGLKSNTVASSLRALKTKRLATSPSYGFWRRA